MSLFRIYFWILCLVGLSFFIFESHEEEDMDTSLYDFVAYNVLEEFVDLMEITAWFGRKVKDHIDELVENSFMLLSKQQELLQPAVDLAESTNRTDCSEGVFMNVTDIVFREYFNMNANCPLIGQRMAIFFNEMHNITSRVADIHRRYINSAMQCGPPEFLKPDRDCLQKLISSCREETDVIRKYVFSLNHDVEEFMDGQYEEAFSCAIKGMSYVRSATIAAVNEIRSCLGVESIDLNKKYKSLFVEASMGLLNRKFGHIQVSNELKRREETTPPPKSEEFKYKPPKLPYYQPDPPPHMHGHHPPPPPPHPGYQPPHPQQHQPNPYHQYHQHQMYPQQPHGQPQMHPGMHPQMQQTQPGAQPQTYPQYPQEQPHSYGESPEVQPVTNSAMRSQEHTSQAEGPGVEESSVESFEPSRDQPTMGGHNFENDLDYQPPWRLDPNKIPRYAKKHDTFKAGSLEFDPSELDNINFGADESRNSGDESTNLRPNDEL